MIKKLKLSLEWQKFLLKQRCEEIKDDIYCCKSYFRHIKEIFNYKIYCWASSPKEWIKTWIKCVWYLAEYGTGVTIVKEGQVIATMFELKRNDSDMFRFLVKEEQNEKYYCRL